MSSEFSQTVRSQVLKRDLSRCVRCGHYLPEGGHLHHRQLRSQGGKGVVENAILTCGGCHHWIHMNVSTARALGLIVPSWADPEATPVTTWRGPMLLDVDGGYATHTPPHVPAEW